MVLAGYPGAAGAVLVGKYLGLINGLAIGAGWWWSWWSGCAVARLHLSHRRAPGFLCQLVPSIAHAKTSRTSCKRHSVSQGKGLLRHPL